MGSRTKRTVGPPASFDASRARQSGSSSPDGHVYTRGLRPVRLIHRLSTAEAAVRAVADEIARPVAVPGVVGPPGL